LNTFENSDLVFIVHKSLRLLFPLSFWLASFEKLLLSLESKSSRDFDKIVRTWTAKISKMMFLFRGIMFIGLNIENILFIWNLRSNEHFSIQNDTANDFTPKLAQFKLFNV